MVSRMAEVSLWATQDQERRRLQPIWPLLGEGEETGIRSIRPMLACPFDLAPPASLCDDVVINKGELFLDTKNIKHPFHASTHLPQPPDSLLRSSPFASQSSRPQSSASPTLTCGDAVVNKGGLFSDTQCYHPTGLLS